MNIKKMMRQAVARIMMVALTLSGAFIAPSNPASKAATTAEQPQVSKADTTPQLVISSDGEEVHVYVAKSSEVEVEGFEQDGVVKTKSVEITADYGIAYDGEGSISKVLANGKTAVVTLGDCIINIAVDGEQYGYFSTRCVGTCVISADDLLHMFWLTGNYYAYDLYEDGRCIMLGYTGVTGEQVHYVVAQVGADNIVKGSSSMNTKFHSCIINGLYFYMAQQIGKKRLITRAEFNALVDPQPTVEPTPVPTVKPEPTPAPVVTPEPKPEKTLTPVPVVKTEAPVVTPEPKVEIKTPEPAPVVAQPTLAPAKSFAPLPTIKHIVVPTMRPLEDMVVPKVTPAPNQVVTEISVEWWYEKYITGEINWEQFWQLAFGINIDTQSHTESSTRATVDFWWDKYVAKEISWEQLQQMVWGKAWTTQEIVEGSKHIHNVYDEDGKLIDTYEEWVETSNGQGEEKGSSTTDVSGKQVENETEKGTGGATAKVDTVSDKTTHTDVQGTAEAANQGHAEFAVTETGHGTAQAEIVTTVGEDLLPSKTNNKGKGKHKKKYKWHVTKDKGKIFLVHKEVVCHINFQPSKSSTAHFGGDPFKGVKFAGYTRKSHQVFFLNKDGSYTIVKRGKKGKGTWKPRTIKGNWNHVQVGKSTGLVLKVCQKGNNKVRSVANAKPKKVS